jgi:hypothetical protein
MRMHPFVADGIGVFVLAALAGLAAWIVAIVYSKEDAIWAWSLGFPLLAICGLFAWHSEKWPTDSRDALLYALGSLPVGVVFLFIDGLIGGSTDPKLPFRDAIWHSGSPFGTVLTIVICPGFTLVALAGAVRGFFLASDADSRMQS